jgi:hypothetical protein
VTYLPAASLGCGNQLICLPRNEGGRSFKTASIFHREHHYDFTTASKYVSWNSNVRALWYQK